MSDYITTYTKKHFTPLTPDPWDLDIMDIAHALSLMVRANGHFPEFYSVAQHSLHCAKEAIARKADPRLVLLCLLHDASEAYIADVTRPLKKNMPNYLEAESKLQDAIYITLVGGLPDETEKAFIKTIDDTLLYHEFYHYMGERLFDEEPVLYSNPQFETLPFKQSENEFLWMYAELMVQLSELRDVKMIGLDLDGTLLSPDGTVSERTIKTLSLAAECGIEIVPASGRSFEGMPDYVKNLPGVNYLITTNGADVYTTSGERIYERSMPCEDSARLVAQILEKNIITGAYIDGRGYMEREAFETLSQRGVPEAIAEYFRTTRTLVDSLPEFILENKRDVQIITCHFQDVPEELQAEVTGMVKNYDNLIYVWGGPENIDITHFEATKGYGLNALGEKLGIPASKTVAFGDSENDADMLRNAGFGFAMENGDHYAAEAANFMTTSNENDGVAYAISRLISGKAQSID